MTYCVGMRLHAGLVFLADTLYSRPVRVAPPPGLAIAPAAQPVQSVAGQPGAQKQY